MTRGTVLSPSEQPTGSLRGHFQLELPIEASETTEGRPRVRLGECGFVLIGEGFQPDPRNDAGSRVLVVAPMVHLEGWVVDEQNAPLGGAWPSPAAFRSKLYASSPWTFERCGKGKVTEP